jgi:hypothetical protein
MLDGLSRPIAFDPEVWLAYSLCKQRMPRLQELADNPFAIS